MWQVLGAHVQSMPEQQRKKSVRIACRAQQGYLGEHDAVRGVHPPLPDEKGAVYAHTKARFFASG